MPSGKGYFVGRAQVEGRSVGTGQRHVLSEVVVEVVVGLVSALHLAASEYVNVVTAGVGGLHYAVDTHLPAVRLRFDERHLGERHGAELRAVVG